MKPEETVSTLVKNDLEIGDETNEGNKTSANSWLEYCGFHSFSKHKLLTFEVCNPKLQRSAQQSARWTTHKEAAVYLL